MRCICYEPSERASAAQLLEDPFLVDSIKPPAASTNETNHTSTAGTKVEDFRKMGNQGQSRFTAGMPTTTPGKLATAPRTGSHGSAALTNDVHIDTMPPGPMAWSSEPGVADASAPGKLAARTPMKRATRTPGKLAQRTVIHQADAEVEHNAFVPMEDRGDIGVFKQMLNAPHAMAAGVAVKDATVQLGALCDKRNEARSFLKGQIEEVLQSNPADQKEKLERILEQAEELHRAAYQDVMNGVSEEPEFDELLDVVAEACSCLASPAPQQRTEAARNVEILYSDAENVSDAFLRFVQGLRDKTCNSKLHVAQHEGEVYTTVLDPPQKALVLKNEARVLVKTGLQPGPAGEHFMCGKCFDIVRAGLAFESIADIKVALKLVLACDQNMELELGLGKMLLGDFARSIRVVRIKNRFEATTPGGWGDIMVNFYFEADQNKHIVELQLMHGRMMTVRKAMKGHTAYNQARTAAELLERLGAAPRAAPTTSPRKLNHRVVKAISLQIEERFGGVIAVLLEKNAALERRCAKLESDVTSLRREVTKGCCD